MAIFESRCGIGSLTNHSTSTEIRFDPPFDSDQIVVTVTEWRNEPHPTLSNIWIVSINRDGFIVGHARIDVIEGVNTPSFAWISQSGKLKISSDGKISTDGN
jgi:hypothetical protein